MRVEKLELNGFKSFADKTTFILHPGITCIVGPNGCGKSNVVDAFKWVLGEQSAKSLRGGKMEEVIFAGTQTKKSKGMAEVTLVVSGMAGEPDNGKEHATTISRRLYRSGDSEYLINKTQSRLRDIRDIFLDTGLEVKSYSILEQERISAILNAKAEDRRFIIEEVAGVIKYKVRRNEARVKLDHSRLNLQRISDVVGEVKRQINSLDRQVKKAERYKRLMQELKDLEVRIARQRAGVLQEELDTVTEALRVQREEETSLRAELSTHETEVEARRIAMAEAERALADMQAELQDLNTRMAEQQKNLALSRTNREHLLANSQRLSLELESATRRREETLALIEESSVTLATLREELSALEQDETARAELLASTQRDIAGAEALIERKRREAFRLSEELSAMRNDLGRMSSTLEGLGDKDSKVAQEALGLDKDLGLTEEAGRDIQAQMVAQNQSLMHLKEERMALSGDIEQKKTRLDSLNASIAQGREELASLTSRLESLKEMVFSESISDELKTQVEVLASLSDIVEAPGEYEQAIEAALRERVNAFLLADDAKVLQAASLVRGKDVGRTAFMPVAMPWQAQQELPLPEGSMARASEIVRAPEGYANVIRELLLNTAIVRDLETALSMRGKGFTVVTLSGEVVEPTGAVIAGRSSGILPLKRQVRELTSSIQYKQSKLETQRREAQELSRTLEERREAMSLVESRTVETEKALSLLRLRAEKSAEELERISRKLSMLRMEREEFQRERLTLEQQIKAKESDIEAAQLNRTMAEEALLKVQEELSALRGSHEERRAQEMEVRLRLNTQRERIGSLEREMRQAQRLVQELEANEQRFREELSGADARAIELDQLALDSQEALSALALKAEASSTRIAQARDGLTGESDTLQGQERSIRSLRSRIDECTQHCAEMDVRRAEGALRLENLLTTIRNTYAIELADVELQSVGQDDEAMVVDLKDKIEKLGPVSLGSLEEYEELSTRYGFLTQQQEDLQRSIAELEEAISRINATTKKKLREAYDELRTKFAEVFLTLFGGGKAELVLTDEDNILESGIDIVAQPPGKKLQNITLMSGGEKTLTALALLFASFLIKPTPLCVLDEADAALDESNTQKFAQMIRELSRSTQFIVITHNRVTMESADYIYGITMEEPGSSKAISLQMAEA